MADPVFRLHRQAGLALYKETTPGVAPATGPGKVVPYVSRTFGVKEAMGQTKRKPNTFNPVRTPRGFMTADGDIVTIADPGFIGLMLHMLFGPATITGVAAPYTHVWKIGSADGGTLTVEEFDTVAAKGDQANGVKVIGFAMEAAKQATDLDATFNLMGIGKGEQNATLIDVFPEVFNNEALNMAKAAVKIDGTASTLITDSKVSGKRFTSVPEVCNGLVYGSYLIAGGWESLDVALTGIWTSGTDDIRLLASGQHAIEMSWAINAGTSLAVLTPKVDCFVDNVPSLGDNDGERRISLTGKASDVGATEASAIVVTLNSSVADYGAAWLV